MRFTGYGLRILIFFNLNVYFRATLGHFFEFSDGVKTWERGKSMENSSNICKRRNM